MFSEQIKYQLDFAKKSNIFYLLANGNELERNRDIKRLKHYLNNDTSNRISLVNYHECFSNYDYLNEVQSIIENTKDKEIYISAGTSTPFKHFYHPLVNILFWKTAKMRENISWHSDKKSILFFDKNLYKSKITKINKGILSVRKETPFRNDLFSIIDKDKFNGIIRYGKWADDRFKEDDYYKKLISTFPNFINLLSEYKSSYVSFVIESQLNDMMNPLTEKTLIAFLTRTLPIVLGGKNYVKELKEMGFYVCNDEFGFDGDEYETLSFDKINSYNKCIETYNQMSINEIQDIYNSNIDKIEHNYKIVSEILFDKQKII